MQREFKANLQQSLSILVAKMQEQFPGMLWEPKEERFRVSLDTIAASRRWIVNGSVRDSDDIPGFVTVLKYEWQMFSGPGLHMGVSENGGTLI